MRREGDRGFLWAIRAGAAIVTVEAHSMEEGAEVAVLRTQLGDCGADYSILQE
jgi:hypothetical protein